VAIGPLVWASGAIEEGCVGELAAEAMAPVVTRRAPPSRAEVNSWCFIVESLLEFTSSV
jgi:hypothetical protein